MHRLPLILATPSITWDRLLPEPVLFERALNVANVRQTEELLAALDKRMDEHIGKAYEEAMDFLVVIQQLKTDDRQRFELLTKVIVCAPRKSPALLSALTIRASMNFHKFCFAGAVNDYEMYLVLKETTVHTTLCEVHGNMTVCFYLMRRYGKARKHLRLFKKSKENIHNHIKKFASELNDKEDLRPSFSSLSEPYNGFHFDSNGLSDACCDVTNDTNAKRVDGIYAKTNIPADSIIFMAQPIAQSLSTPFVQCELCLRKTDLIYTCLNCRYKTYCSLKCMEKDKLLHDFECVGYKNLTLLMLDTTSVFRVFVRLSMLLDRTIFTDNEYNDLKACAEVLEKLEKYRPAVNIEGMEYLRLLTFKPDYTKLSEAQYATLVATVFRLTIFIEQKTKIIEHLYQGLCISKKQKMLLLGSILMRLQCHLSLGTINVEYCFKPNLQSYDDNQLDFKKLLDPVDEFVEDVEMYYNVNDKDIKHYLDQLLQSQTGKENITQDKLSKLTAKHRPLAIFKNRLEEIYFCPDLSHILLIGDGSDEPLTNEAALMIRKHIAEMDETQRFSFVNACAQLFHQHYYYYFIELRMRKSYARQVHSLYCPTVTKFHTGVPNVEIVVLQNGLIEGKSLREIQPGEELIVSYRADAFERETQNAQFLGIEEPANVRLGIYCETCKDVIITPVHVKCPQCGANYANLSAKYKTEMNLINEEITRRTIDANDRDLFLYNFASYQHVRRRYVPASEMCLTVEISFATAFAMKNFGDHTYNILMMVKSKLESSYYESVLLCNTHYGRILLAILAIIHLNIYQRSTLPISCLLELCEFGLLITTAQRDYIMVNEAFDIGCAHVMDNMRMLLQWRKLLLNTELRTKKNLLMQQRQQSSSDSMPALIDP